MKIAITSTGESVESLIDKHFGRCFCFVIYDSESKSYEFIPNPNRDSEEGAGTASVHYISSQKVSKIVSGEFGIKIKPLLDRLKIQMIVIKDDGMSVRDIIQLLEH